MPPPKKPAPRAKSSHKTPTKSPKDKAVMKSIQEQMKKDKMNNLQITVEFDTVAASNLSAPAKHHASPEDASKVGKIQKKPSERVPEHDKEETTVEEGEIPMEEDDGAESVQIVQEVVDIASVASSAKSDEESEVSKKDRLKDRLRARAASPIPPPPLASTSAAANDKKDVYYRGKWMTSAEMVARVDNEKLNKSFATISEVNRRRSGNPPIKKKPTPKKK
jgi:hypothetical protein